MQIKMYQKANMQQALQLAQEAMHLGEVPVGAVLIRGDEIISTGHNRVEHTQDPTQHAELLVLKAAHEKLQTRYLSEYTLYVTLEPCAMCAAAISLSRVGVVYFGAYDPKGGGVEHGARVFDHKTCVHKPDIWGGYETEASEALLRSFFASLR